MNDVYLYPYSAEEAQRRDELDLWRESYKANVACKEAIEAAIRRDFDGMRLKEDCAKNVLDEYGFKRVNYVLAATLQAKDWDGRFSPKNQAWAKSFFIPEDKQRNYRFIVESHPAVLNSFVDEARRAYQALGLFDHTHCEQDSGSLDYTGRVLVLSPDILKESFWRQEDQLWYACDGFGCSPTARGRSVRCVCLGDGEETRWNRHDFTGVLRDECLPDWAREKLEQIEAPKQDDPEMTMRGL